MAKYFKAVKSFKDLKEQYRTLLKANHPDNGGNTETMQEINVEFDALFSIWKQKYETESNQSVNETAESTRSEFYTEFGWKGDNYDVNLSLKEIAKIVRTYVKEKYPTYKFSIRTAYASMCQELHVVMKESPIPIYKTFDELTDKDKTDIYRMLYRDGKFNKNSWYPYELDEAIKDAWKDDYSARYKIINEVTQAVADDVNSFVNSYNYDDSDGRIDYFDRNFYYFGCIGGNGDDIKVVPKTPRVSKKRDDVTVSKSESKSESNCEYEIKESTHTKTGKKIWLVKLLKSLSNDEYQKENQKMKSLKGYYSRFTHSFVFDYDPSEALRMA